MVLLHLLTSQIVPEELVVTMFGPAGLVDVVGLVPGVGVEAGWSVVARLPLTHQQNISAQQPTDILVDQGGSVGRCTNSVNIIIGFIFIPMSSPSKMFSCVEADEILKSPINNSTAKNHWSMAKDDRFKRPKIECHAIYNIPEMKDNQNRKAGNGIGKKTDLEFNKNPQHVVPSPDTYNLPTFVETNKLHAKGFTPRKGRDEIAPMSYIEIEPGRMPPPGRYDEYRYNESPKWSMRPRTSSEIFPQTTVKIVPEPGRYINQEAIANRQDGKYYLSNHGSSKSKVFNPPRSQRFHKSTTPVPDPSNYHPQNNLSPEGKYVLSNNYSAGQRKFLFGRRQSFTDVTARRSFTPGPGSYRVPSEFGQYDKKNLRISMTSMRQRAQNLSSKTDRTKASQLDLI